MQLRQLRGGHQHPWPCCEVMTGGRERFGAIRVSIVPIDVGKRIMNHSPVIPINRCYQMVFVYDCCTYDQMGSLKELLRIYLT